jgi:hypothetical protein
MRSKLTAPDLERLARTPCPMASLASSGIKLFNSALAASCSRKAERVRQKMPANSAQEFEPLISTTRTASMRTRGGSTKRSRGGSPVSTQRQNFFSAVSSRCWYRGIESVLRKAGVEFLEENGGGPGVRLKKSHKRRA